MVIITGVMLLIIGLVACFFGLRLYRYVLALFGFIGGYYTVSGLLATQSDVIQIAGSIVAGIVVAILFWTFYRFAYTLYGLFLGIAVAALIAKSLAVSSGIFLLMAIVLGLLGAVAGNQLADLIIQLSTAFGGSTQVISGIAAIAAALNISLPLVDPSHGAVSTDTTAGVITLVAVVGLGIVGFLYQRLNMPKSE